MMMMVGVLAAAEAEVPFPTPKTDLPRGRGSRQGGVAVGVAFEFIKYL